MFKCPYVPGCVKQLLGDKIRVARPLSQFLYMKCIQLSFSDATKCAAVDRSEKTTSSPPANGCMQNQERAHLLPLWLKSPSISMDDLEWAMHSMEQGTIPSWAGERSVVRTRHQSGLSWSRSRTSTVWPRRTVSSPLLPLLAMKSWITTVSSQPPDSWNGGRTGIKHEVVIIQVFFRFADLFLMVTRQ